MSVSFPFAAIVGQDELKDALLRVAVDPAIGGLLVTGTRGTAKSTAVRALADLLPALDVVPGDPFNRAPEADATERARIATPFVELPVGATEDRVIGTLDVRALLAGERRFELGLLARANRGILYVDEVNLLPDHLVDVVLDAAATGTNVVERDGASFAHDARIVLVGTMNPEEGELRPQLLDRFGLCVAIENDGDVDRRVAIVERRVAFDLDPTGFCAAYAAETAAARERVATAHRLLPHVHVERASLRRAAELAVAAHVEGMRAELTIVRAARAIAALDGRDIVRADDIDRAAPAALAHRRREPTPQAPPPTPRTPPPPTTPQAPPARATSPAAEAASAPASGASGTTRTDATGPTTARPQERGADPASRARPDTVAVQTFDIGAGAALRADLDRTLARASRLEFTNVARGRGDATLGGGAATRIVTVTSSRIAALATLRAAAREHARGDVALAIGERHLRFIRRRGRARRLIVFLVDASGSMAAAARMRAAKGVVCSLLADAYLRRDAVALIAFRGTDARTLVPPTRSALLAYRRLRTLATGGRTPLGPGLASACDLIVAHARRAPASEPHLVVVSDGRANAPHPGAFASVRDAAERLRNRRVRALCVDTETGRLRLGLAADLAASLDATYRRLDNCSERALGATVREWMATA